MHQIKMVFIVGCQRTGTTLIGNILGAHPDAFLIDEPNEVYPWIEAILEDKDETSINLLFRQCCQMARDNYFNPDLKCAENGKLSETISHLILKTPNLTYSADKISASFPEPICIFPFRDARDIVVSMTKLDWIPMVENQLERIKSNPKILSRFAAEVHELEKPDIQPHEARAYIAKIKMHLRDTFTYSNMRTLEIRYEDLVQNPDEWCDKLAQHVGLSVQENGMDHTKVLRGWGPGLTFRRRKIDVLSLNQWTHYLSKKEEEDIWRITQPLMEALGYPRQIDNPSNTIQWNNLKSKLKYQPIIATGRGGSGTRLLSQLLQALNVFMGNQLNGMDDSIEWVSILYKIGIERNRQPTSEPLTHWLHPLRETAADILTTANWNGHQPWGWKLPETMLALPEVFDAFEGGKLIHIIRHPVDTSLRRTHMTSRADNVLGKSILYAAYDYIGWDSDRWKTDPDYIRNAASWLYQVEAVARFGREKLSPDRYLEIRYEDLCSDPMSTFKSLSKFLNIQAPSQPLKLDIDPLRRRNWNPPDSRADEVWNLCGPIAKKLGYHSIIK